MGSHFHEVWHLFLAVLGVFVWEKGLTYLTQWKKRASQGEGVERHLELKTYIFNTHKPK